MNRAEFLQHVQRAIDPPTHVYYKKGGTTLEGGLDCEQWFRHCFRLWGIELHPNIHVARKDFEIVEGPTRLMDVGVFRTEERDERHLVIFLDERWFCHCSKTTNGVARAEITRGYHYELLFTVRHKQFLTTPCN